MTPQAYHPIQYPGIDANRIIPVKYKLIFVFPTRLNAIYRSLLYNYLSFQRLSSHFILSPVLPFLY